MSTAADDHGRLRTGTPTTYYEGVTKIPGFGDAPDRCRPLQPVGACENGHALLGRSSCQTYRCPDHFRDRIEEAVIPIVALLAAYRHAVPGAEKRTHHLAASGPQDRRYSADQMWATRSEAYDALEAAGVRGGAVVTHPYRTSERGDALYATAREHGDVREGTGKWKFLRDVADDWNDLTRYIEPAPHYHCLGPAESVEPDDVEGDWVVKRIRTFKPFHYHDTEAYRDMVASAYYVLTHTAVQQGRQGTTYFGDLHSFQPEEELTTAVWERIQVEAEKAVRQVPGEPLATEGSMLENCEECPREECEAMVFDLIHLRDRLEDSDWVSNVLARPKGRKRWLRMRGLLAYWEGRTDRPPPSTLESEPRMLEWLEARGAKFTQGPQPTSIKSFS